MTSFVLDPQQTKLLPEHDYSKKEEEPVANNSGNSYQHKYNATKAA